MRGRVDVVQRTTAYEGGTITPLEEMRAPEGSPEMYLHV